MLRTLLTATMVLGASLGASETTYREIFPTGPDVAASGWYYHIDANGADASDRKAWGEAPGAGKQPAVNSLPATEDTLWKGFVWLLHGDRFALWTDEHAIEQPLQRVQWHMATPGAEEVRVMLQVDVDADGRDAEDPWFVSGQTFREGTKPAITAAPSQTLRVPGAAWRRLDFVPGTTLGTPGAETALPAGTVVAFGLYLQGRTGSCVFDSFQIDAGAALPVTDERAAVDHSTTDLDAAYAWDQVAIGGGGYFTAIRFHPTVPGLVSLRSDMDGPWFKRSPEETWDFMVANPMEPRPGPGAEGMAFDPRDDQTVHAVFGIGRFEMGIYRSRDGGERWTRQHELFASSGGGGDERKANYSVAVDPAQPDVVYVGSRRDGLLRSTDAGETWQTIFTPEPADAAIRNVLVLDGERVEGRSATIAIGIQGHGVWLSTDGGAGFVAIGGPGKPHYLVADGRGGFYATGGDGLQRYADGTWSDLTPPESKALYGIAVDPADPARIAVVGNYKGAIDQGRWGLFRSLDGGATWLPPAVTGFGFKQGITNVPTGAWVDRFFLYAPVVLATDPHHPGAAYLADAFQVWHTTDLWADEVRCTWQSLGAENIVPLATMTPPQDTAGRVAPFTSGMADVRGFVHRDIHATPTEVISAPGEWVIDVNGLDHCEHVPRIQMASKHHRDPKGASLILRSEDGGASWRTVASPMDGKRHGGAKLAIAGADPEVVVFASGDPAGGNFASQDGGRSWTRCRVAGSDAALPTLMDRSGSFNYATCVAADREEAATFYAYQGHGEGKGRFWASTDGGLNWSTTASLPVHYPHDDQSPAQVAAMPGRAGTVWVALGNHGIHRSSDHGRSFDKIEAFPGSRPCLFAFGAPAPGAEHATAYVYAQGPDDAEGEWGLYRSLDAGDTWTRLPLDVHPRLHGTFGMAADRQVFGRIYLHGIGIWVAEPQVTGAE